MKWGYLLSLQLCEDRCILEKLKKLACNNVLAILTTHIETRRYENSSSESDRLLDVRHLYPPIKIQISVVYSFVSNLSSNELLVPLKEHYN